MATTWVTAAADFVAIIAFGIMALVGIITAIEAMNEDGSYAATLQRHGF